MANPDQSEVFESAVLTVLMSFLHFATAFCVLIVLFLVAAAALDLSPALRNLALRVEQRIKRMRGDAAA